MNRTWATAAFGVVLVALVVVLTFPRVSRHEGPNVTTPVPTEAPATPPAGTPETSPESPAGPAKDRTRTGRSPSAGTPGAAPSAEATAAERARLRASVAVVHKHAIGSCRGTLRASADGLRYDTDYDRDRFVLLFNQVEQFELDYGKKNLRVKRRGGRIWNFTTPSDRAEPLLAFYRDVERARPNLGTRNQ